MPKARLLIIATLACLAQSLCACGGDSSGAGVSLVSVPDNFSSETAVQSLLEARSRAVAADPDDAGLHRSLGMALAANGGTELAESCYRNALALDPDDHESRFQLAKALAERGDIDGQMQELRSIISKDANFFAAHYALGCVLLDLGELDESESMFKAVKRGIGSTLMGELGLGLVALARDKPEVALPLLAAAAKKYPNDEFIRFQIGQAYLAMGEEAKAERWLQEIEDASGRSTLSSPGDAEMRRYAVSRGSQITLALAMIARNEHAKAVPLLEALVSADPDDSAASNNLHVAYVGMGRLDDALRVIDATIESSPDQYKAHINRASCLLRIAEGTRQAGLIPQSLEELEDALRSSEEGIKRAPRFGQAQRVKAQILAALRRDAEAIQAFRKAIELGENQEETFIEMGVPVRRYSGVAAFEALLREGLEFDGVRPRLRFELCGVFLSTDRGPEARREQRKLAELAPGHHYAKRADEILKERGY